MARQLTDEERLLRSISEKTWQAQVLQTLALAGFEPSLTYHTYDSRRSHAGFPDLVALRHDHRGVTLAVLELKRETGKATLEQEHWLDAWAQLAVHAGPDVRVVTGVFKPSDAERLTELLQQGRDPMTDQQTEEAHSLRVRGTDYTWRDRYVQRVAGEK